VSESQMCASALTKCSIIATEVVGYVLHLWFGSWLVSTYGTFSMKVAKQRSILNSPTKNNFPLASLEHVSSLRGSHKYVRLNLDRVINVFPSTSGIISASNNGW
jgi:hypothetical protein